MDAADKLIEEFDDHVELIKKTEEEFIWCHDTCRDQFVDMVNSVVFKCSQANDLFRETKITFEEFSNLMQVGMRTLKILKTNLEEMKTHVEGLDHPDINVGFVGEA